MSIVESRTGFELATPRSRRELIPDLDAPPSETPRCPSMDFLKNMLFILERVHVHALDCVQQRVRDEVGGTRWGGEADSPLGAELDMVDRRS